MYYILYEFGLHKCFIETNKEDFYKLINDLSLEFVILRKEVTNFCVEYYLINYYNDEQLIGTYLL